VKEAIDKCKEKLKKIITGESRLRNPPISVIYCPEKLIKEIYIQYIALLKQLKREFPSWNYEILNSEKILFNILKDFEYIAGDEFIKNCDREIFAKDMYTSVKSELIKKIQEKIDYIINNYKEGLPPPFLVILNIHACYHYIQTKDIISSIYNTKNKILILILYLQKEMEPTSQKEIFKKANYNINTYYLFENI